MKMKTTLGDYILLIVLIIGIGVSFLMSFSASTGSTVIVELKDLPVYKGNLAENRKVTIKGTHGDVRIQIRDGKVAVVFAECPNKVCVRTGWRSRSGESIICVPNRVIVRILGEETNVIQGVTG